MQKKNNNRITRIHSRGWEEGKRIKGRVGWMDGWTDGYSLTLTLFGLRGLQELRND